MPTTTTTPNDATMPNDGRSTAVQPATPMAVAPAPMATAPRTQPGSGSGSGGSGAWTRREVGQLLVLLVRGMVAAEALVRVGDRIATRLEALTLADGAEVLSDASDVGDGQEGSDNPEAAGWAEGEGDLSDAEAEEIMRRLEAGERIDGV